MLQSWIAIALVLLGLAFVLGTNSSFLALFKHRYAYEAYMREDGNYKWCVTRDGEPVRAKHR